jgi:iron complex outermembrane recepter protein
MRSALALLLSASLIPTAVAQQTAADSKEDSKDESVKLEKFEVTGSRIPRSEVEGPSPIKVITRAEISATGRSNAAELLRDIPEASAIGINESGTTAAVRGANALDLRNLGANNTLVIVDGRRVVLTGNNSGGTTFVDLNRFPVSMIERIEVLKDGASAIYGADATAGVVNIITRKDYNGAEIGTTYGNTFKTDVAELSANVFAGASSGKVRGSVALSYFKRNALHARDRDFSANADKTAQALAHGYVDDANAGLWDLRSGTGNIARISVRAGQVQGGIPTVGVAPNGYAYPAGTAINIPGVADGTSIARLPGTGGTIPGTLTSASPAFTGVTNSPAGGVYNATMANLFVAQRLSPGQTPSNLYNFQEFVWLVPAQERVGMRTQFSFDFTPEIEGYLTASFQQNKSEIQLAPSPISTAGDNQIYVPRYNYWNPFGVDINFNYRPTEIGPRISNVTNNNWEVLTGIKGKFLERFNWDTAAYFGYDEVADVTRNAISESRVRAALARTDPTALNIFGGADFKNNPATIESLKVTDQKGGSAELRLYDFKINGTLLDIPTGEVGGAIYTEFREERFKESNSPIATVLDDIIGQVRLADSTSAQRSVMSLAAEVSIPLVSPKTIPFIESADLSVAARFEDFSDGYDSGWKPYVGLKYRPLKDLVLRASFTQAFRAPTLPQLYGGVRESLPNALPDLARPQALTGDPFDGAATQRLVRAGGNRNLQPEESETYQVGFVYEVPSKIAYLKGLSFEVTRFQIEQENIITTTGTTYLRQNEFGDAAGLIVRDPGTETYTNTTANPITVYTGPGAYSTATGSTTVKIVQPGQSITVPGRIRYLSDTSVNLAFQRVKGWDFGVRYEKKTNTLGRFVARASASYLEEYTFSRTPGAALPNFIDRDGYPRYRIQSAVGWSYKEWQANLGYNYTAAYGDYDLDGFRVKAYDVWNANVSYQVPAGVKWMEGVIVTLGLDNVLDEDPDLYYDGVGYDSSTVGRPQGRFGYLSLRKEF